MSFRKIKGVRMAGVIFLFFVLSFLSFIGVFHYFQLFQRSASYPPKRVIKQKIVVLATAGFLSLLIGMILLSVNR